jgi:hypothetical protein
MRLILSLLVTLGPVSICGAVPVTFTYEGAGSGTLNGVSFGATTFVITAQGDTSNRTGSGPYSIQHGTAQIQLTGLGTYSFTSLTRTFVNQSIQLVGFSRAPGSDLFWGPTNAQFSNWNMLSSIGPVAGNGSLLQWTLTPAITTNAGVLVFNNGTTAATFTARLVPEPGSIWLVLMSITFGTLFCRAGRVARA